MTDEEFEKAIERMKNHHFRKPYQSAFKPVLDEQGRSYEDNYYVECLNCGRCMIVGKCCDNRLTQNMIGKMMEEK